MPNNRKIFIRGSLVELCFRTEVDLPFVATPYIQLIIKSILARAQSLYPLTLCHALLMSNHPHLLVKVDNPRDIKNFVAYFKRESAHAINRFLGRKKRTVWCDGYDSPVVLDAKKAVERIVYLYTNPQNANLVETIEEYPNFSTWKNFIEGGATTTFKRIVRDRIPKLPKRTLSFALQDQIAEELEKGGLEEYTLTIEPDAWMQCFPELDGSDAVEVNSEIEARIRSQERLLNRRRKRRVKGSHALRLEQMNASHEPKKRSKRSVCLATRCEIRGIFLAWFRAMAFEARLKFQQWREGDLLADLPPGMFWPGGELREEVKMVI